MQNQYPALTAMGIKNPSQINHFTVYTSQQEMDVLRIKYARPKGSFLPVTRSYKFPRTPKPQAQDGTMVTVYEVSPQLATAMNELDQIVDNRQSVKEVQQNLSHELDRIQSEFQADIDGLRQLINKLDT